jgi:hypothetical protein
MRITALILFTSLTFFQVAAQELNCQVSIITNQKLEITSVEKEILAELENVIFEIMNNTQWTKDKFTPEERINCNLQLQIDEVPASGVFAGSMQVQSSRPVYNSDYNTLVFNFQDDHIRFAYSRGENLAYAPNQYRHELTSVLAFYAYFIIGMDYDTFSSRGGTKSFTEAQQIVVNAQSSGLPGWATNAKGKQNRYWLIDNILHELFSPLRDCSYEYHRKGLDTMYDNKDAARKSIYSALNKLVKVTATRPNSLNLLNFVQAKRDELKNLYSEADQREKTEIVNLLKRIDPANSSRYQEILN